MHMYSEFEKEFDKPMADIGKSFKNEYSKAVDSFKDFELEPDEKKAVIKAVLQKILDDYSETEAKTDAGRVGRFFAKIVSFLSKIIKFK